MPDREPSAAGALYPNLKSGTPDVVDQRRQGTIADAMFPSLGPKTKPAPVLRTYRQPEQSLAERCDEDPWLEHRLALAGLVRRR